MEELRYAEARASKKVHPQERSNIITRMFFCWMVPYFVKGYRKELSEDDMYGPLKGHESSRLGDKLEKAWNYQLAHKTNPSLFAALFKVFSVELMLYALFFAFMEFVVKLSQPLLITKFLKFYEPGQTEVTKEQTYIFATFLVLAAFADVVGKHSYLLGIIHLGMKIQVALSSLIYRKALKLSKSELAETTTGQMVTLLSNDVSRFNHATSHIHYIWVTPLETFVIMYLLYIYVGPTGIAGTGFLILFTPFQMWMAKKTSQNRLKTALRTDQRVRLMNEIISGIQVIKMYTWEKPFTKLVEISRRKEMEHIKANSVIRAFVMSFNLVLNRAAIFFCILAYVLTGNTINATFAYTVTSFYGQIRQVVTVAFPKAVTQLAEAHVSVKRIQRFLLAEEKYKTDGSYNVNIDKNQLDMNDTDKGQIITMENGTTGTFKITKQQIEVGIHLKNVSVKWNNFLSECSLDNITFHAYSGQIIGVVGPVGGGKTTLLHTILQELPPISGTVDINGTLSYASQEPWLFGGTVRQNIIFGQEFDSKKYEEVVRVCALERDFRLFAYGDRTLIGDKGVTLSGGQKARINLARAVYKDADIYLLDDPLSAVDTHVGRELFDNCISGYLRDKCVVLVTHQLQYLKNICNIYLLEAGKVKASGSYENLKALDTDFTKLFLANENEEENNKINSKRDKRRKSKDSSNQDAPVQEREQRGSGIISWKVYKAYILAGGSWFSASAVLATFVMSQVVASLTDYFVTIWVNMDQLRFENSLANGTIQNGTIENGTIKNGTILVENRHSGVEGILEYLFNLILTETTSIYIYSSLVFITLSLTLTRSLYFYSFCMKASTRLHNKMFSKIVYATMRFFNTNPTGRILNRFSKDIGVIDEYLPLTIIDTLQIGLTVLAISLVIGSLNLWILIPTIIILIIFYFLRIVFLASSRNIKRVEAIARSPMYTHLAASVQGLTTIRAFEAEPILKEEFDNYQNDYSAACYLFIAANRTFGFWLDFHCVVYIALVIISILFVKKEELGGNVGLALTQAISLTGRFQMGMRQWSELENNMTSVERVQEYIKVTPEKDEEIREPPKFWPEEGNIIFDNVSLRYSPDDPYVLKNLNFEIKGKEKVGVVGRTGAGKSSLIVALFRLTNIDGRILLDNVNTKEIALQTLRSKISIIPQEPVLFSGTLRRNLDPFNEYNDDVLWSALSEVELKNAVMDLPAGLDSTMSEGGSNFSVGQRQLLCLARAIIRQNKILVLDEATANVDPHTDSLIQTTIRSKFSNCTVLTIAHRLHTIMDSDKVLVIDAGEAVEFDHPYRLLKNENGIFYKLVLRTGRTMKDNLTIIAKENFRKVHM